MKALTVWQPWASLISIGAKPFEFRGYAAPKAFQGRPLAIHAGARPIRRSEVVELIEGLERGDPICLQKEAALPFLRRVLAALPPPKRQSKPAELPPFLFGADPAPLSERRPISIDDVEPYTPPYSAIVCIVTLGEPKRGDLCARDMGLDVGGNDSDRPNHWNWGWPMLDVRPLIPPEPARGAQGFWDVSLLEMHT